MKNGLGHFRSLSRWAKKAAMVNRAQRRRQASLLRRSGAAPAAPAFAGIEALESRLLMAADITVLGNNISIVDGDSTPIAADFTDFGVVGQGTIA
ncbi:MAG: LEPR-XLL domain-containing protein, partial [Rhizobiales bacterium]|nr:LEPR-XLL domain-containing protein [Hyphomicrobiales bacterium]